MPGEGERAVMRIPGIQPAVSPSCRPGGPGPDDPVPVLVELNVLYPGGLAVVADKFFRLWTEHYERWASPAAPTAEPAATMAGPPVPAGLQRVTSKLYQCVLTRRQLQELIQSDRESAASPAGPSVIFKAWPDYVLYPADRPIGTHGQGGCRLALLQRPRPRHRLGRHRFWRRWLPPAFQRPRAGRRSGCGARPAAGAHRRAAPGLHRARPAPR